MIIRRNRVKKCEKKHQGEPGEERNGRQERDKTKIEKENMLLSRKREKEKE